MGAITLAIGLTIEITVQTRKHSSRMHTDCAVTMPRCERLGMRPIVDRQTPVKTLPSLAVGKKLKHANSIITIILTQKKKIDLLFIHAIDSGQK